MKKLYLYGAGGLGREIADALLSGGRRVEGFIDDRLEPGSTVGGLPVVGPGSVQEGASIVLTVAHSPSKRTIHTRIARERPDLTIESYVHPSAYVGERSAPGEGSIIYLNAMVTVDIEIGPCVLVYMGASVGHDARVGGYCTLFANVAVGGGALLGEGVTVGSGAVILPGVEVGRGSVIGAGSVVISPLPSGVVAAGVPAKVIRETGPHPV